MPKVEKASRLIYLNKTCYNGLFRVNQAGEFNSPFGHYKNPNIINEPVLRAVSKYFNNNEITFLNEDFSGNIIKIKERGVCLFGSALRSCFRYGKFYGI